MNKWTVQCTEDENGDTILPFPEEMLKQMDWREGDVLDFEMNNDDSCLVVNLTWEARQLPDNIA